jgi:hypothetical protein
VGVQVRDECVEEAELAFEDLDVLLDGAGLGCGGAAVLLVSGFIKEGSEAEDGIARGLLLGGIEEVLGLIDAGVLLGGSVVHVAERSGGLCGAPADVVEGADVEVNQHAGVRGELAVLDREIEDLEIVFEGGLLGVDVGGDVGE